MDHEGGDTADQGGAWLLAAEAHARGRGHACSLGSPALSVTIAY